ncbi:ubiquinone biosynthesis protein UbiH [Comamonas serinivorans]|uniref:Ubiquinone biosynthesis protein UbiH n=1 Tax=Comamonas serinivorans TaxID=1082851 RepID=A0A1Y0ELJ3_9BURK|nr:FAD-dependent monooxygenase [Comamonas serinivorans]ARU04525.1 ubiquinone biosynthesis protein UbiH [Comamonas serinivorans]
MSDTPDVCVRGSGIVGRTLALLLARARLRVALVDTEATALSGPHSAATRSDSGHADVRAYALNAHARGLLEGLRCWPDEQHATPVQAMQVFSADGGQLHFDAQTQNVGALNWIVDVPVLEGLLRDAVRFQSAIDVVRQPVPAPLTVICEGKASDTRAALGVHFDSVAYPQHAIALRLQAEVPHGQVARQWFEDGHILAFLPLGGPEGREVAVVWSVPQTAAADLLALPDADLASRLAEASRQTLGALTLTSRRVSWPLQLGRAARWVGDMPGQATGAVWALAGDAAHTMHPLAGQGLNVGLADVAELAQILQTRESWRSVGDMRLLRRYERARQADVRAMQLATDGLQQLFWHDNALVSGLRDWGLRAFDASGPLKRWVTRQAMGVARSR